MKTGAYHYKYGDEAYWIGPWIYTNWTYSLATGVWSPNPTLGSTLWDADAAVFTGVSTYAWAPWGVNTISNVANALQITYVADNRGAKVTFGTAADLSTDLSTATWYVFQVDASVNVGTFNMRHRYFTGGFLSRANLANGTHKYAFCPTTTSNDSIETYPMGAGQVYTLDNLSLKALTTAHLFALRNFGRQVGISANLTMTAGLPGGVEARYSDVNNYVHCWHDGTNLHLDKVVGGTVTSLINTAAAYGAGRAIEIRWNGANTAQAWYNGVQVGADQDVSTVPAGNWAGLFGTDSTVQLSGITWS